MATRKRIRVPVFHTHTGDPSKYEEGIPLAPDIYTHSGHMNRRPPSEFASEAFENHFSAKVKQSPFEPDEVMIYRYGVLIRPREGELTQSMISEIQRLLSDYPGSSLHVIDEDTTFSVRINLGSPMRGQLAEDVKKDLLKQKDLLDEIYELIAEEYGMPEWIIFWDTEEPGWESG